MGSDEHYFTIDQIRSLRKTLKANARSYLHRSIRDRVDSSDLVQHALFEMLKNLSQLVGKPKKVVFGWMMAVMKNNAMNTARRIDVENKYTQLLAEIEKERADRFLQEIIQFELRIMPRP
jgi:DNA-directed RNA polymerase specialized sigma24 family protein